MHAEIKALIDAYELRPLPVEGTLFASTYRSALELSPGKPAATAMIGLFCEEPRSVTLFHRLPADEIWHFYAGDPLRLVLLYPNGSSRDVIMGNDPLQGQAVQFMVPAGVWQAGRLLEGGRYALFGCTMTPGFDGSMFEGAGRSQLLQQYPARAADITALSCPPGQRSMPEGFKS